MPELPEVEHIARSLNKITAGRTIITAKLIRERLAPDISKASFARRLRNSKICCVRRRGKHILFDLANGETLITHLRMTGSFSLLTADDHDPKFTHAVFYLNGDERLVFEDQRHFGMMKVVRTNKLSETPEIKKLAPEPFSVEYSQDYVRAILKKTRKPVKEALLDQTKFCGLGNIYAAEALFLAGIDPRTPACKVTRARADRLHETSRQVLFEAIEINVRAAIDPRNIEGSYSSSDNWLVYDREGEPCRTCNRPIKRIKQGGRSTFYCPACQRNRTTAR